MCSTGGIRRWDSGVRTTCSDDYLWLPYVTSRYIKAYRRSVILDEPVNFLEGRLLNPGEDSYYELPIISIQSVSLYEHCVNAIQHGLQFGEHGLPLIGSGDWNDGMDKVGHQGKEKVYGWHFFFMMC